jgi:hypothetical protein
MNSYLLKNFLQKEIYKWLYRCGKSKWVSNDIYRRIYGTDINWDNPVTLNEKLMVLKHKKFWNSPPQRLISQCADKYNVRIYVRDIHPELLTNLVNKGIYNSTNEIDWNLLPNQFALKCTHGCKMNIIVSDKSKVDQNNIYNQLNKWQRQKFGYQTGEWQYLFIEPRILCEEYYGNSDGAYPIDYKLFCANGKIICTEVCFEREKGLKVLFMDNNWNRLYIDKANLSDKYVISEPSQFNKMKEYAIDLAKPFKFVRVDFYEINGKIKLSELTFTPAFNCISSINQKGQILLGEQLQID